MAETTRRVAIGIDMDRPMKHHHDMARGVLEYGRGQGWCCEFQPTFETAPTLSVERLARFDGVVARASQALGQVAAQTAVPVVNVGDSSPEKTLPGVFVDKTEAGRMVGKMLVEQGFKNFGFLSFHKDVYAGEMAEAFRQACQSSCRRFLDLKIDFEFGHFDEPRWNRLQQVFTEWIESTPVPIGMLATDHILTRYLADFCRIRGLAIPDDVALVAGENSELVCAGVEPTLTSIDNGFKRVGYEAARLLDALMNGQPPPDQPIRVKSASIIPRRSTDVYAVDDRLIAQALRLIADNSHQPINVEWVAAQLPVTRRTLERRFRQALGRSIRQQIIATRMKRARKLLMETDEPVRTVAVHSGFRDAEHLCKIFSQQEGISPGRYRRKLRYTDQEG